MKMVIIINQKITLHFITTNNENYFLQISEICQMNFFATEKYGQ